MQMDYKRLFLMVVFASSVFMLWEKWSAYNTQAQIPIADSSLSGKQSEGVPAPMASSSAGDFIAKALPSDTNGKVASTYKEVAQVHVKTDSLIATISAQGGDIIRVELLKHKESEDHSKNFVVLQDEGTHFYVANTGLIGEGLPTHKTIFDLKAGDYSLVEGQDKLDIRMTAPAVNGVAVTKVLTFHRNSYVIDVRYEVSNNSNSNLSTSAYYQFARDAKPTEHSAGFFGGVSAFTGPAVYTEAKKFQTISFDDITKDKAKYEHSAKDGWLAMVQHYFVSAWLPPADVQREFFTHKISEGIFGAGVKLPLSVASGQKSSLDMRLYVGPQEQNKLKDIAPGLNLVVNYGYVTIIAVPLFWLLSTIHGFVGNWGWAILIVTLLIKLAFFPLSAASYKSMAKMKTLMPRMKALQERYKDDKMKLNQAMMEMYKTEKVNPMGGCLPILIQMPVFIALYWVLLGVVEMRHAPWIGWITDLSVMDPYYILPLIMGATMLIQSKLNPAPPDPVQAKIMMLMPVLFTFMFLWFPSGLVLYWVLNNTLSIAQQWYVTRMIERAGAGTK